MKTLKLSFLATIMLVAGTTVKAQTADEIIDKYAAAVGGKDNWKKINTLKMEGSMNAQGQEIGVVITQVHNKAMRQDISVMGMTGYSIITNKEGWSYMPFAGQTKAEAMTADQVKQSQSELDLHNDELFDYKSQGAKVEFLGKDDVEGTQCFKLKHTSKDGQEKTMYFDASNYYLIKETQKVTADGKEMESSNTLSNYTKQAEGVVIPMTMQTDYGEVTLKKVEINKPIDESVFKPSAN